MKKISATRLAVLALCILLLTASASAAQDGRLVSLEYASARDGDGIMVNSGELVTVRGVATVEPYVFSREYALFFIQDERAGLAVFSRSKSVAVPSFKRGDLMEVRGRLTQYKGQPQVIADQIRVIGQGREPRPLEIEPRELATARFQGRLIETMGVLDGVVDRNGDRMVLVGPDQVVVSVYISRAQLGPVRRQTFKRGDLIKIVGIATQFDPEAPYHSGWQVRIRQTSDLVKLPPLLVPGKYVVGGFLLLAGVALASLIWIILLRRRVRSATASLTETVSILKAQQEATTDGILIIDMAGCIRSVNRRFTAMWDLPWTTESGGTLDDVLERQRELAAVPEDVSRIAAEASESEGIPYSADLVLTDGRIIASSRSALNLDDPGAGGAVWTFRDVTERELMREQVERSTRVASLGRLAASISHEFNNVLMGIQPFAELIRRRTEDERITGPADRILAAVGRGRRTTAEVLRLTHSFELKTRTVLIASLLQDLESELRASLHPDIEVIMEPAPGDATIIADSQNLIQVFVNLAVNAQHAMSNKGRLRITSRINRRSVFSFGAVPSDREFIHFTVEDNGGGIPDELIEHIFEPLFTTKKGNGSGLGLAIAQQVVAAHQGTIFVESRQGESTKFHLFIPRGGAYTPPQVRPSVSSIASCRVLLVEDDLQVAEGLTLMLEGAGATVAGVTTGEEASDAVGKFGPDVVVLDLDLPGIGGEEVYARLSVQWPDLPVLFSSGHCSEDKIRPHLVAGRSVFLQKPYEFSTLSETLLALLAAARAT